MSLALADGSAAELTTAAIVASAVSSLACLRPMVVGACTWLVCTPFGCTTTTSEKIANYNPDLVVSSYNGAGKNPWTEVRAFDTDINRGGIVGGAPPSPHRDIAGHGRSVNLNYKDAQAFGHPMAGQFNCPSAATPILPYFLSSLDALGWRWSIPETFYPEALLPGLREIGAWPLNTWGAVYPRSGWIMQTEEPKTGAVLAQRVGDIVTRPGQPRIYNYLQSGGITNIKDYLVWLPPPLMEGNAKTGDWQMLSPAISPTCETFGANDVASFGGWAAGKIDTGGDYAWTLWRPYKCCKIKGEFLFDVDVVPYP
jgi:integrating conjugative element protein (TIGR03756 family)